MSNTLCFSQRITAAATICILSFSGISTNFCVATDPLRAEESAVTSDEQLVEFEHRFRELIRLRDEVDVSSQLAGLQTERQDEDDRADVDEDEDLRDDEDDSDMKDMDDSESDMDEDYDAEQEDPYFDSSNERVARFELNRFQLPDLRATSIKTSDIGNGRLPESFRDNESSPAIPLPESAEIRGDGWEYSTRYWAAANTFSHPRYFEDRMLERHGHEPYPRLTPILSGAKFFSTVGRLPYLMTISPPCECESTLGYFRSGTCVHPYRQGVPCRKDAFGTQIGATAAAALILP